jgi:UDP-glucose 4-epimerase
LRVATLLNSASFCRAECSIPLGYYRNNTMNSRALIETAVKQGKRNFIFSSTAAVNGNPTRVPVREDHPTGPTSPGHDQHRFCPKNSD